jgi:mono/diheme cytochrome c family protein
MTYRLAGMLCARWNWLAAVAVLSMVPASGLRAGETVLERFDDKIAPIFIDHCYQCHESAVAKGNVALDKFTSAEAIAANPNLWWSVLKNVRAGIMPPAGKPRPTSEELAALADWIKRDVFKSDPGDPDPGRVTVRRLNRVEYRNTIRDLTGFDFNAEAEFPPDDTGYGFDTIGDVLSVSPLLLEKYMQAAETIVAAAVPTVSRVVPQRKYRGNEFRGPTGSANGDRLSFYKKAKVSRLYSVDAEGDYRFVLNSAVDGAFTFDPGSCAVVFRVDDREEHRATYGWQDEKSYRYVIEKHLTAGDHRLSFELEPTTAPEKQLTPLDYRIVSLNIEGPLDPKTWTRPPNYEKFFSKNEPPEGASERAVYARAVLGRFASKAFRRPIDNRTLDRLVTLAEGIYTQPGRRFEEGVARAMVAVLSSPRFVFRVEGIEPKSKPTGSGNSSLDSYALASRLSYFLWSTMPDDELLGLAEKGTLRENLVAQVKRMREDPRADSLTRNFVGQWLQVLDVEGFTIDVRAVLRQDGGPRPRVILDTDLRRAMRRESEMLFGHIAREDRSVLELIDCDYTFLNAKLAQFYGIKDVSGREMKKVELPKDSPRGGVLTHAAILMVTSNPTRTSPVKRGQFILDNILGTPAPPPPPDIPALEESKLSAKGKTPTVRELMALHRAKPLCSSCHARMDPLGLALENFNALGLWREKESGQAIDASGRLLTGESFHDIRDLKRILKAEHSRDFYRCLTEKLLTYAVGRGLDYYDVETVDQIVDRLDREGGRFSALLMGVIESAPFQKRRDAASVAGASIPTTSLRAGGQLKP